MRRRHFLLLSVVVLVVGMTSFVTGRLVASRRQAESEPDGWLQGAPVRIRQADRQFEFSARRLAQTVTSQKNALAVLLADPCSTDAQVLTQVDRVIESNAVLMTAVGRHVAELRDSLPPQQRQRLMRSCVGSLRSQVQRRYRWRGGVQEEAARQGGGNGNGNGYGRGRGAGASGAGRGRQYRGGRGSNEALAGRLQLTAEQMAFAQDHDPNFSEDCARLKDEVGAACAALLAAFDDTQLGDEEILARLDGLIEAHSGLERRVAQYVIMMRPHLSSRQRQHLAGLSRGGSRYRGRGPVSKGTGSIGQWMSGMACGPILADSI